MSGLTERYGYGVTLGCDPTGATTFAVLGAIVEGIEGPDLKTDAIDSTLLAAKFKSKLGGQVDLGTATTTIAYDPQDTTTTTLTTLMSNSNIANWQISYPKIGTETIQTDTFLGFVSGIKRVVKRDALITADIEITVTGAKLGVGGQEAKVVSE